MTWPKLLFAMVPAIGLGSALTYTIYKSSIVIHNGLMHNAIIANYSRFGEIDPEKLVVIDDSRAYFIRDNTLWTADVQDDYIVRSTLKVVDVMNVEGNRLKEVMAAVDALNMIDDEEGDDDATV